MMGGMGEENSRQTDNSSAVATELLLTSSFFIVSLFSLGFLLFRL